MTKSIYLIGFMGSGKTTIGKKISRELQLDFADMDEVIEKRLNKSIPMIFKDKGEAYFRIQETVVLKQLKVPIIATGGGIIERSENRIFMKENGIIIYLRTSFTEIQNRLKDDNERPLWVNGDSKKLYKKRIPLYENIADFTIDTEKYRKEEIIKKIKGIISFQ
ncbi:shikimate kinase [Virgibacillus soli]|uniref:Shikimate kinase n=1 Tax=Paracerasibacillus soli TaxID=480284 RepID=A0ABU5CSN8_9BACI|nr:shikimate kinase [Virgibacillus soli]MDY0408428.1 shikimate kinase [Virgibacillus soli]